MNELGLMANRPEYQRIFNRALELLSSNTQESEQELLEMVRKAKKEQDNMFLHPPKRQRTARAVSNADHGEGKPRVAVTGAATGEQVGQVSSQAVKSTGTTGIPRLGAMGGVARGRVEKPKRKTGR